MKLRRVVSVDAAGEEPVIERWVDGAWRADATSSAMSHWLAPVPAARLAPAARRADGAALPCQPLSFRDCMLFRQHWVQSSRGCARRFLPWSAPFTKLYEGLTARDFPAFRPPALWDAQPVYYFGNHLSFVVSGTPVAIPRASTAFDFELELGWVITRVLRDASVAEAEAAIGGFVVVNDFSCRDLQRAEMQTGLGPQKSKHCVSSMSDTLVTADELRGGVASLRGCVELNGRRTHADGDHCGSNQLFTGCEIIASDAAIRQMRHLSPRTLTGLCRAGAVLRHGPPSGITRGPSTTSWRGCARCSRSTSTSPFPGTAHSRPGATCSYSSTTGTTRASNSPTTRPGARAVAPSPGRRRALSRALDAATRPAPPRRRGSRPSRESADESRGSPRSRGSGGHGC